MLIEVPDIVPLLQPDQTGLCGQAVVAMAAGVSLHTAIIACGLSTLNDDGSTLTKDLVRGLSKLKVKTGTPYGFSGQHKNIMRNLPVRAVAIIADNKANWNHAVLIWDGFVYDPGVGSAIPMPIYEQFFVSRAYSSNYMLPKGTYKRIQAYWRIIIPILGKKING